ncbi:hypothetical protein D915_005769 [Fasciola hepatica]|uniref:SH3 domain-containing protein n=1 Tax=Fasciola hepatica TaxID=6192 RepID=A0A4E0S0H3_FASHE|nr:hypothetical protein D915_005769 [Fasciola hepatica]
MQAARFLYRITMSAAQQKSPHSSARGRPDGEAKSGDYSDQLPRTGVLTGSGKLETKSNHAVAIYDYRAERSDELTLHRGDQLQLLYRDTPKWWMAKDLRSGREGFVPSSYLAYDEKSAMNPTGGTLESERTPPQRSGVSSRRVVQLMGQSTSETCLKPPSIVIQDWDQTQATSESRRKNASGLSSPTNLMVLAPKSPQTGKLEKLPHQGRPLPLGEESHKKEPRSNISSLEVQGNSVARFESESSRSSVPFSMSSSKRGSRPLPELD